MIEALESGARPIAEWIKSTGMLQLQHSIKHGTMVALTPEARDWLKARRIRKLMGKGKAQSSKPPRTKATAERQHPIWANGAWIWPDAPGYQHAVQAQRKRQAQPANPRRD